VHRRQAPVDVEQDVDVGADRLADRREHLDRLALVLLGNEGAPGARQRIELERGEPLLDHRCGSAGVIVRRRHLIAPAVGVDPDAVAAGAAEQIVDRLATRLADDVPERLLDAGERRIELERAAPDREVLIGHLGDVLDLERIAPDNVAADLLDQGQDRSVAIVLAPLTS